MGLCDRGRRGAIRWIGYVNTGHNGTPAVLGGGPVSSTFNGTATILRGGGDMSGCKEARRSFDTREGDGKNKKMMMKKKGE